MPGLLRDDLDGVLHWSGHQIAARAAIVVGAAIAHLAAVSAGGELLVPLALGVLALAGACAVRPDTHAGLALVLGICVHWAVVVDDRTSPWVVLAAAGLLTTHAAMSFATTAPGSATWTAPAVRRWARRTAAVAGATAASWLVTVGVDALDVSGGPVLLVVSVLLLTGGALAVRERSLEGTSEGAPE